MSLVCLDDLIALARSFTHLSEEDQKKTEKAFRYGWELYQQNKGGMSLSDCIIEGFDDEPFYKLHKNIHSLARVLYMTESVPVEEGPRLKTKATLELEALVHALIREPSVPYTLLYNVLDELEIRIEGTRYNITQILEQEPDFDFISFSPDQLKNYLEFLTKKAKYKPQILIKDSDDGIEFNHISEKFPTYNPSEESFESYVEECAMNIYTQNKSVVLIQDFLRQYGKTARLKSLNEANRKSLVKELLLCICVASHGIARSSVTNDSKYTMWLYRQINVIDGADFIQPYTQTGQAPFRSNAFTSTSSSNNFSFLSGRDYNGQMIIIDRGLGHQLRHSRHAEENEVLFLPGTQFQPIDHGKFMSYGKKMSFFAVKAVRGVLPKKDSSPWMDALYALRIIDKMFEKYLRENKHSWFRRLFDTVPNDKKRACVISPREVIQTLLNEIKPDSPSLIIKERLSIDSIRACRDAIQVGIENNKKLVAVARERRRPASLGKTHAVLEDALERIDKIINSMNASASCRVF